MPARPTAHEGGTAVTSSTGATGSVIPRGIEDGRLSLGPAVLDDLFPEGDAFRRSLQTYVALLALAALIATFGLYQDSVASLIGAMLVAPLGGAIMALAGGLVTGRSRWVVITLLEVTLGALLVVAVGYAVAAVLPNPLHLTPALEATRMIDEAAADSGRIAMLRSLGTDDSERSHRAATPAAPRRRQPSGPAGRSGRPAARRTAARGRPTPKIARG